MRTVIIALFILLVAFPLRRPYFTHWRFTFPATFGASIGWIVGELLVGAGVPWWVAAWVIFCLFIFTGKAGRDFFEDVFPPNRT